MKFQSNWQFIAAIEKTYETTFPKSELLNTIINTLHSFNKEPSDES